MKASPDVLVVDAVLVLEFPYPLLRLIEIPVMGFDDCILQNAKSAKNIHQSTKDENDNSFHSIRFIVCQILSGKTVCSSSNSKSPWLSTSTLSYPTPFFFLWYSPAGIPLIVCGFIVEGVPR